MANGPVVQTSDGLNNGMMMVPMMPSGTIAQPMNKMMTIRQPNSIGPGPVRGCIQIQQPIGLPRGMPINVNRMARPQVNTQFINPSQANTSGGMIQQQITMSSPVNLVSSPPFDSRVGNTDFHVNFSFFSLHVMGLQLISLATLDKFKLANNSPWSTLLEA